MKLITIGIDKNGAASILAASTVPVDEQRVRFQEFNVGDMPKGIVSVELYAFERATSGIDPDARKRGQDGYLTESDGQTYPAELYAARAKWRVDDIVAHAKADFEGKPYKAATAIPEKVSDLPKPAKKKSDAELATT